MVYLLHYSVCLCVPFVCVYDLLSVAQLPVSVLRTANGYRRRLVDFSNLIN